MPSIRVGLRTVGQDSSKTYIFLSNSKYVYRKKLKIIMPLINNKIGRCCINIYNRRLNRLNVTERSNFVIINWLLK